MSDTHTYTAFVRWPGDGETVSEEIDVKAPNITEAKRLAEVELTANYRPGWKIAHVEPRIGWYF
jgi:hypothetical protein